MKPFMKFFTLAVFSLLLMSTSKVDAEALELMDVDVENSIDIDNELTIEKRNNGTISPLSNPQDLTDQQLNGVLNEMKYTSEDIETMSRSLKEMLVESGGVAVEVDTELKEYFNDTKGNKIEITDANRKEVEEYIEEEVGPQYVENQASPYIGMGSNKDDRFAANGRLQYLGKDQYGKYFIYKYIDSFSWKKKLAMQYYDNISHAWQDTEGLVADNKYNGVYNWRDIYDRPKSAKMDLSNQGSLYGRIGTFFVNNTYDHDGYLVDTIMVPVKYKYNTERWIAKYTHNYTLLLKPEITLGPLSIKIPDGLTHKTWEWENTFTVIGDQA